MREINPMNHLSLHKWLGISMLIMSLVGCGEKSLDAKKYVAWVKNKENGLNKTTEIGNYVFEVQQKPSEYIVVNEFKGNTTDKNKILKRVQEIDDLVYFDLKISLKDGGDFLEKTSVDQPDYYQKLYYLSFEFQKEIKLEENGELKDCILYHFEKSYDLKGIRTFVLGFKKSKTASDKTLVIDSKFLESGIVKIKFNKELLQELPELSI